MSSLVSWLITLNEIELLFFTIFSVLGLFIIFSILSLHYLERRIILTDIQFRIGLFNEYILQVVWLLFSLELFVYLFYVVFTTFNPFY